MTRYLKIMASFTLVALIAGCGTVNRSSVSRSTVPKIDKVFFAQHHVLEPNDPLFKLVGNLETLIKVQVYSDVSDPSPYVFAKLRLCDKTREIRLLGPKTLPKRPAGDAASMTHSYDDSFTAMIPREWVTAGLAVEVELRGYDYVNSQDDSDFVNVNPRREITIYDTRTIDQLKIGAPTKMVMHLFDIHYFGRGKGADYPNGWEAELKAKLPLAELDTRRVRNIVFDEIVIPSTPGLPPKRFDNATALTEFAEAHDKKNSHKFSHTIGLLAYQWGSALKRAGSGSALYRTYCINSAGILSSGRGGRYCTSNHLHRRGLIIHELGHAYGLPHWFKRKDYPYTLPAEGDNAGKPKPRIPYAGPKWGFNLNTREFLPPFVMKDGKIVWIHDPMHGGGKNRHGTGVYTHFSDYSMRRMQERIERAGVCWNPATGKYAMWNQETGSYDKVVENDGLKLPIERDVEVVSVMATANGTIPEANIVYPPIGPYVAGTVRTFDANSADDRNAAATFGYSAKTCNVAMRVIQGGKVTSYLLRVGISSKDPVRAFNVTAINLPTKNGDVTKVELIHCPDLITKGVTADHKVLATWPKSK